MPAKKHPATTGASATRKRTKAKPASRPKTVRKSAVKKIPAKQGKRAHEGTDYEVGYKKPPREYQFRPGQSGNPSGSTRAKTHLWRFFCEYLAMTEKELSAILRHKDQLTIARQVALKMAGQVQRGVPARSVASILKYAIDRDLGKPPISVEVESRPEPLSHEECERIRQTLRERQRPAPPTPSKRGSHDDRA